MMVNNIPNFKELAEEIIKKEKEMDAKNPDRVNGCFTQDQFELFESVMEGLERKYRKGTLTNSKMAEELITAVTQLLVETSRHTDDVNKLTACLRFYFLARQTFLSTFGKDLEARKKRNRIGAFVMALSIYSPAPIVYPAQRIVAQWLGEKERYVRSCYENFDDRNYWINHKKKNPNSCSFVLSKTNELADLLIEQDGKPFPETHHNTLMAYKCFLSDFLENYKRNTTLTRDMFSYSPNIEDSELRILKMRTLQNKYA